MGDGRTCNNQDSFYIDIMGYWKCIPDKLEAPQTHCINSSVLTKSFYEDQPVKDFSIFHWCQEEINICRDALILKIPATKLLTAVFKCRFKNWRIILHDWANFLTTVIVEQPNQECSLRYFESSSSAYALIDKISGRKHFDAAWPNHTVSLFTMGPSGSGAYAFSDFGWDV